MPTYLYLIKKPTGVGQKDYLRYDLVTNPLCSKETYDEVLEIIHGPDAVIKSYELPEDCLESQVLSIDIKLTGKTPKEKERIERLFQDTKGIGLDVIAP